MVKRASLHCPVPCQAKTHDFHQLLWKQDYSTSNQHLHLWGKRQGRASSMTDDAGKQTLGEKTYALMAMTAHMEGDQIFTDTARKPGSPGGRNPLTPPVTAQIS